MEVFEAVRTVLAVREYQDKAIAPDTMRRILEAAHLTASSANRQPWHFIAGPYIAQAPFAVVVCTEADSRFAVSDASRAAQSMVLTAWSEGIGSNWAGFGGLEGVKAILGIPESLDVLCVIPFGYPARPVGKGKKERKPLGEVASRNHYGQAFA
jgi:nitroreductase